MDGRGRGREGGMVTPPKLGQNMLKLLGSPLFSQRGSSLNLGPTCLAHPVDTSAEDRTGLPRNLGVGAISKVRPLRRCDRLHPLHLPANRLGCSKGKRAERLVKSSHSHHTGGWRSSSPSLCLSKRVFFALTESAPLASREFKG